MYICMYACACHRVCVCVCVCGNIPTAVRTCANWLHAPRMRLECVVSVPAVLSAAAVLLEPTAGLVRCAETSCALGRNMACSNLTPRYVLWNVAISHVETTNVSRVCACVHDCNLSCFFLNVTYAALQLSRVPCNVWISFEQPDTWGHTVPSATDDVWQ